MKEKILALLAIADAVIVHDSPLLGSFPIECEDGRLTFEWEQDGDNYEAIITEESLENAVVTSIGFDVLDINGDDCTLAIYSLKPLWQE